MTIQRQNKLLSLLLVIVVFGAGVVLLKSVNTLIPQVSACCYEAECGNCWDSVGPGCGGAGSGLHCQQACCVPDSSPNYQGGGGNNSPPPPIYDSGGNIIPDSSCGDICATGTKIDGTIVMDTGVEDCGSLSCADWDCDGDNNCWRGCYGPSCGGGCSGNCGGVSCGNDNGCGNNCGSTDVGTPGAVTITSPVGTSGNPQIVRIDDDGRTYALPGSLDFSWLNNEANHALTDYYRPEMYQVGNATPIETGFDAPTATIDHNSGNRYQGDYYWRIQAGNNTCTNYPPAVATVGAWSTNQYFRLDHFPTSTALSINGTSCAASGCNAKSIITNFDNNHDRKVPVTATFTDWDSPSGSRKSDMENAYVVLNTNNTSNVVQNLGTAMPLRVIYTDHGNGTWSLSSTSTKNVDIVDAVTNNAADTVGTSSRSYNAATHVLTVSFSLDLNQMTSPNCADDFGANIYAYATDFYSQTAGVVRQVGTGAFSVQSDAHAANALDVWGGRYVCTQAVSQNLGNVTSPATYAVSATVAGTCTGVTSPFAISAPSSPASSVQLPYRDAYGSNTCIMTLTGATSGFYLRGTDFTDVGGNDTTIASGTDTNSAVNGGWRNAVETNTLKYTDTAPTTGALLLNGTDCTGSACDGKNIVTDFDPAYPTHTLQQIPVTVKITDVDTPPDEPDTAYYSNIKKIDFFLNETNNFNSYFFEAQYLDNGDGTWSLTPSGTKAQILPGTPNGISISGTPTRSLAGNVLTLNFTLDVSTMSGDQQFLTNMYIGAEDIGGGTYPASTGIVAGAGNFAQTDAAGNVTSALDIWNGKDIYVTGNMYQVTNANDICVNGARSQSGPNAVFPLSNIPLTVSYTPNNSGAWPISINNWIGQNNYQPYYYYNYADNGNLGYEVTYQPTVTTSDYFLVSLDLQRYGGTCSTTVVGGKIADMRLNRGGYRPDDSSHLDAAFGAKQISQVWSRSVDGDYFANSNVNTIVETSTCTSDDCYFTTAQVAPVNGLPISNGTFSGINNRYGSPNNWSAQSAGSPARVPFTSYAIPSYTALKAEFNGAGFTEVTPATGQKYKLSTLSPQVDQVYFINGDFEIDQNFSVATNHYVVFIVAGNITLDAKDGAAIPVVITDVEGIFIAPSGSFTVNDDGAPNYDVTAKDDQLTIQGVVAVGGITYLNRTMGAANNGDAPMIFQARPDMVEELKTSNNALSVSALYYQGEY